MNRRARNDIPFRHCEEFCDEAISEEEDKRAIATPFHRRARNDNPFRHCEEFCDEAISEEEDKRAIATSFILHPSYKGFTKG